MAGNFWYNAHMRLLNRLVCFARLVASAVAILVAVQARGAIKYDYYVSQTGGDDGYDGRTAEKPFKTIDAALSAASNGQTVAVLPGTYTYPAFYSKADYREGAPRRISLFAVDTGGSDETVIDASLVAEPNDARIVGCLSEMWSLFDGFTFRGCRPKSSANRFSPYMYAYFRGCVFEHMDTTNQNAAAVWSWCVLEGCIVYDARVTAASGTPSMFQSCSVMDSFVQFSCGGGDLSLACGSYFDNCFLTGGPLGTLDSEPGQGDGFFNSTLLLDGVAFPNGRSDVGWYDYDGVWRKDKPAPLDGCLVGIDGYTNTYFVTDSYVTNFAACAAAIDPATLRIADASTMAYYYGYDALEDRLIMKANARPRTLTWNGGESGNLSSRSWDGGAGLHVTPYTGDTLVFPKGGRFVNDIGGLTLAGLSFEATNDVAIAGGPIEMAGGGVGVLAAGPGAVNIEAPLSFGASPTSTVCVGASAGVSLSIAAIAGSARALFYGPGTVLLGTAAMSTGEFVLSNVATVVCLDGFSWGGERLFVVDGSTLVVDGAVTLSERLDVSVRDRTGAVAAPSRLVLNSDVAFNYLTINGSIRPGRKSYGSSQSGAEIRDDTHFGGDCTAWVRHPERFTIVIR